MWVPFACWLLCFSSQGSLLELQGRRGGGMGCVARAGSKACRVEDSMQYDWVGKCFSRKVYACLCASVVGVGWASDSLRARQELCAKTSPAPLPQTSRHAQHCRALPRIVDHSTPDLLSIATIFVRCPISCIASTYRALPQISGIALECGLGGVCVCASLFIQLWTYHYPLPA